VRTREKSLGQTPQPCTAMTEKAEANALPANLMRTMPYTAYVAVASYAAVFLSSNAAWLMLALVVGEVLNYTMKTCLRALVGPEATLLRRPDGAADSGIYPQHYPRESLSSGMPSGHGQTSAFLSTVFTRHILERRWYSCATSCSIWEVVLPICYVWLIAILVMVSRSRFAGVLGVRIDGRLVAHHTVLQVMVGATIGMCLGNSTFEWFSGHGWLVWFWPPPVILLLTAAGAVLDQRYVRTHDNSSGGSDEDDGSTNSGGKSSRDSGSLESTEAGSFSSEIELQSCSQTSLQFIRR